MEVAEIIALIIIGVFFVQLLLIVLLVKGVKKWKIKEHLAQLRIKELHVSDIEEAKDLLEDYHERIESAKTQNNSLAEKIKKLRDESDILESKICDKTKSV